MSKNVIVTGASSGFGALTVRALADAGHLVYAGMRSMETRNQQAAADATAYATEREADLRPVEMDVSDQASVDAAVARVLAEAGRIDVVVHNAGHMSLGPAEAFSPDQLAASYDVNVLSTQRVNRAVLPHLRDQRDGLLVWVGSSSARGGTPPYLGPYFAAKAAMDSLAVSYAAEVARFGIETSIVVPGSFTTGTNHFANAGHADDTETAAAYETAYAGLLDQVADPLADLAPADQDPTEVTRAVVGLVEAPKGRRPFRIHIDPADDGAEVVLDVGDRIRHFGSSTYPAYRIVQAQWAARVHHFGRFVTEQPAYSILQRGVEAHVLPAAQEYGLGVLAWSPLASGWLSGAVRKGREVTTNRSALMPQRFDTTLAANQAKLDAVRGSSGTSSNRPRAITYWRWTPSLRPRTPNQRSGPHGFTSTPSPNRPKICAAASTPPTTKPPTSQPSPRDQTQ